MLTRQALSDWDCMFYFAGLIRLLSYMGQKNLSLQVQVPVFRTWKNFWNGAWRSLIPSPLKWPQWSLLCRDGFDTWMRPWQRRSQQPYGCSRALMDCNTLLCYHDFLIRYFAIWFILGKVWMNLSGDFVVYMVESSIFDFLNLLLLLLMPGWIYH